MSTERSLFGAACELSTCGLRARSFCFGSWRRCHAAAAFRRAISCRSPGVDSFKRCAGPHMRIQVHHMSPPPKLRVLCDSTPVARCALSTLVQRRSERTGMTCWAATARTSAEIEWYGLLHLPAPACLEADPPGHSASGQAHPATTGA